MYEWDFGDNTTSNLTNPFTFIPANKIYTVKLKITSAGQCGTARASKIILPTGAFPVNTDFNVFGGCDSGYFRFELKTQPPSQGAGGQFTWAFGEGTTSTELNPTHIYSQPGKYHITLKYKTSTACLDNSTETDMDMLKLKRTLSHSGIKHLQWPTN